MTDGINHIRFWLIELLLRWEGRVTTSALREAFNICRQQASKDINAYKHRYPANLSYNPRQKCYQPTQVFCASHLQGNVSEYLNWLTHRAYPQSRQAELTPRHAVLAVPERRVSPMIMQALVSALRQPQRLEVEYNSVSSSEADGRIIVPVRFVKTGQRWHLRAFCEKSQHYRDFVLSRFYGQPESLGEPLAPLPADDAWETFISLELQPDPRLSPTQQLALSHDYGMAGGKLSITTRAALAHYLLLELHVSVKMLDGNPAAQQLILSNYEAVKPWLFDS